MNRRRFLQLLNIGVATVATPRVFYGPGHGVIYQPGVTRLVDREVHVRYAPLGQGIEVLLVDPYQQEIVERIAQVNGWLEFLNGETRRLFKIPSGTKITRVVDDRLWQPIFKGDDQCTVEISFEV